MKKEDLAYAAGFVDGEGCILIGCKNGKYHQYRIVINVSQAGEIGKEIMEWFRVNFKGSVFFSGKKKYFRWAIETHQGYCFLKQIYPYLKRKKKQAGLAIEFQETINKVGHNYYKDRLEKYCYFETLKQEISWLNQCKI